MIFARVAMSYMNYPRCGVCALVRVYPFLKNAFFRISVILTLKHHSFKKEINNIDSGPGPGPGPDRAFY